MSHYTQGWNAGESEAITFNHHITPANYARDVRSMVARGYIHPEHAVGKLDAWEKHRLLTPEQYKNVKAQVNDLKRRGENRGLMYRHLHKSLAHEQHRPRFHEIRENIKRTNYAAYTKKQKELESFPKPHLPSTSSLYTPPRVQKNVRTAYQRGRNEGEHEAIMFHHVNPANYARGVRQDVASGEMHPDHAVGKLDAWEKHRLIAPEQYKSIKAQVNDLKLRGETRGMMYKHLHKAVADHEQHRPRFDAIRENIRHH